MEQLFGTKIGSALFEYTDVCMVEESDVFLAGLQTGGIDANGTMKKQLSLGLAHFFRKPETRDR
jgi:hypothetical protein